MHQAMELLCNAQEQMRLTLSALEILNWDNDPATDNLRRTMGRMRHYVRALVVLNARDGRADQMRIWPSLVDQVQAPASRHETVELLNNAMQHLDVAHETHDHAALREADNRLYHYQDKLISHLYLPELDDTVRPEAVINPADMQRTTGAVPRPLPRGQGRFWCIWHRSRQNHDSDGCRWGIEQAALGNPPGRFLPPTRRERLQQRGPSGRELDEVSASDGYLTVRSANFEQQVRHLERSGAQVSLPPALDRRLGLYRSRRDNPSRDDARRSRSPSPLSGSLRAAPRRENNGHERRSE